MTQTAQEKQNLDALKQINKIIESKSFDVTINEDQKIGNKKYLVIVGKDKDNTFRLMEKIENGNSFDREVALDLNEKKFDISILATTGNKIGDLYFNIKNKCYGFREKNYILNTKTGKWEKKIKNPNIFNKLFGR